MKNGKWIKKIERIREQTIAKWNSLGFLDGLKGHVKEDITKLYECCESAKLDEGILPMSIKILTELKPDQEIVGMIKRVEREE